MVYNKFSTINLHVNSILNVQHLRERRRIFNDSIITIKEIDKNIRLSKLLIINLYVNSRDFKYTTLERSIGEKDLIVRLSSYGKNRSILAT